MSYSVPAHSSETAVTVNNIWKRYSRQKRTTLSETLTEFGRALGRRVAGRTPTEQRDNGVFWALKDISFTINRGEIVGIVGNNGAGKSTLLKILSRITPPSQGSVRFSGRVGSLLEVGAGFHPELSGRENIFLNGAILGMSKREIAGQLDAIIDFSGVEAFLDMPVKHYSSGMYMRLAFSVAAHLESEILLVDEVLAVGDTNFQRKCMDRMSDVAKSGRTILLVSHNLTAIQSLCQRALWFEAGQLRGDGQTADVLNEYLKLSSGVEGIPLKTWDPSNAPGDDDFRLERVAIYPVDGRPGDPIDIGSPFCLAVDYVNAFENADINLVWLVHNAEGILLCELGSWNPRPARARGHYRETCLFPADLLNEGALYFSLQVVREHELTYQMPRLISCELLDSPNGRDGWFGHWPGAFRPRLPWTIDRLDNSASEARDL